MRAKLFLSPTLLLSPALLATTLGVLGTQAAANTHSVEPGTPSRIAVDNGPTATTTDWAPLETNEPAVNGESMNRLKSKATLTPPGPDDTAKVPVLLSATARDETVPAVPEGKATKEKEEKDKKETISWTDKELWLTLTGIVALLGTAVPLMAKGFESISLVSRRKKELQHIEDLTELMEKIKKEHVLSKSVEESVSVQIEAEIKTALDQLGRNRAHREEALEVRQKALEKKKEQAQSELPLWRRVLLLYWPRGIGAWIAHGLAFVYAVAAIAGGFEQDTDLWIGSLIILLVSWVFAWFARKRWEKAQILEKGGASVVDPGSVSAAGGA